VQPADFCRAAAAPGGSNFHYATLFHPPAERRALFALFALRGEVQRIAAGTPDPAVMALRRAWWLEELGRVAGGRARHPIGLELQRLLDNGGIDITALQSFAAAGGMNAPRPSAANERRRGTATIWPAAARACGLREDDAIDAVAVAGDLVDAVEAIGAKRVATTESGLASYIGDLRVELDAASGNLLDRGASRAEFCLIMTRLSAAVCAEMASDVPGLARARFALTPLRKLWIAWRTHRAAR
jgi:phytoene synthase